MNIIGFCGRKQSGKDSAANFVFGLHAASLGVVDYFHINEEGNLLFPFIVDGKISDLPFYHFAQSQEMEKFCEERLWPHVKVYAFATKLKNIAMECFKLTYEQCYGTNEEKNSVTRFTWQDFWINKEGSMTAREILQTLGTDVIRSIDFDAWVNACMADVQKRGSELSLITDCRFKNELIAIKDVGGKVIRFTRGDNTDTHKSENELGDTHELYDAVIDNKNISQGEKNELVYNVLREWEMVPEIKNGE